MNRYIAAMTDSELTPEQQEQAKLMAKELAEARQQILEADPTAIIANHAFGIYELAMLHITNDDPDMNAARLAVDSLGVLVEGLAGRLDEAEPALKEALHGVRLLYVERVNALKSAPTITETEAAGSSDGGSGDGGSGDGDPAEEESEDV